MGTRGDWYIKKGDKIEWIGSCTHDAYLFRDRKYHLAKTEEEYRESIELIKKAHGDGWINPEDGWPWPWEKSLHTDKSYIFDNDHLECYSYSFGRTDLDNGVINND